jgi:hypothetical protein
LWNGAARESSDKAVISQDGFLEIHRANRKGVSMLFFILTIVLIIALLGSIPKWPHSRSWGYYPSGGVGLILVVLLVLYLLGRL